MTTYNIKNDIALPKRTAIWVLGAHAYGLLIPLALLWVVVEHYAFVAERMDYPSMLLVAAVLMAAGSAFEIAQNAIDRWVITPDSGSGNGTGFCDMCFYWLLTAGQGAVLIACYGTNSIVLTMTGAIVLAYPKVYIDQRFAFLPLGVLSLASLVALWERTDEPLFFVALVLTPLTLAFFGALLKTGRQFWHGWTTLAASSNALVLAVAFASAADGQPAHWGVALGIAVVLVIPAAIVGRLVRPS